MVTPAAAVALLLLVTLIASGLGVVVSADMLSLLFATELLLAGGNGFDSPLAPARRLVELAADDELAVELVVMSRRGTLFKSSSSATDELLPSGSVRALPSGRAAVEELPSAFSMFADLFTALSLLSAVEELVAASSFDRSADDEFEASVELAPRDDEFVPTDSLSESEELAAATDRDSASEPPDPATAEEALAAVSERATADTLVAGGGSTAAAAFSLTTTTSAGSFVVVVVFPGSVFAAFAEESATKSVSRKKRRCMVSPIDTWWGGGWGGQDRIQVQVHVAKLLRPWPHPHTNTLPYILMIMY